MSRISAARRIESFPARLGGGRGACNTLNRAAGTALTEAGRILGHPATAVAARGKSPSQMSELLRPAAQAGDVWRLGKHRLVCGDATALANVKAALDGHRPNLMVTDPPYGVAYDPEWRVRDLGNRAVAIGAIANDDRFDWRDAWALFPGDVAYVWHGALNGPAVAESLKVCGFLPRAHIVWDKGRLIISRGHYHWRHECCWYLVRKGRTASWAGDRKQTTLWLVPHRKSETGHASQKPVEIMRRPILNHTQPGERVYDPFAGSGTTIIAAEGINRICHAIELNPAHIDVAIARWEAFTGRRAVLEHRDG